MRVQALRHCDARLPAITPRPPQGVFYDDSRPLGVIVKPLFEGQYYELPDAVAEALIAGGAAVAVGAPAATKAQRPVLDKAVEGPTA